MTTPQEGKPEAAEDYDRLWARDWTVTHRSGPINNARYRLIVRELRRGGVTSGRLLDAGCGSGWCLQQIRRRLPGLELVGVDISETAVKDAPADVRPLLRVGLIESMSGELGAGAFDAAVCSEVLEHVPEPGQVAAAVLSTLRPGGLAVFTVPAFMRFWSWKDEHDGHLRRYETAELAALLSGAGFEDVRAFTWGGTLATLYHHASVRAGPDRLYAAGENAVGRAAAFVTRVALCVEDWIPSRSGIQLVASARRPR